ncbi:hypothetical protein [Paracoccus saliphilus]|uniref:Uncharacterized protein n=1 Tax=Paracoccus saliphilus TaxID=405559 RepID=A0ABY7SCU0_9RHOB|nr:hypothetical protein [Paracoccus saliphilus]WCR04388.1 hypothetical protein JHX88_06565 [Paracoccus saliphilus]
MDDLSMDSFSNANRPGDVVRFLTEHPVATGHQCARETPNLLVALGPARERALKSISALRSADFYALYGVEARHV